MKTKWFAVLACLGLSFLLTTCYMNKGPGPTPTPTYPTCDPIEMLSPSLVSPHDGSTISSLQPIFEWASPGYTGNGNMPHQLCSTASFNIYLSSGPFFQDVLGGQAGGVPPFDSLYTKTWTPGTPLEPGREYRWSVRPVSQGVEGPASEVRTFFTGPNCEAGHLSAPIPLAPLNYWNFNNLNDLKLAWWYPDGCLPDSYIVEISPMMQFDNSPLNENTGSPVNSWVPSHTLTDCTRYFWRVSAVKDGQTGQSSQVYNFRVAISGGCPAEANGFIHGTVWEDQCAGPGAGTPVPDPLPLGCAMTANNTLFTNQSYDPGEPGIPGVVVSLGQGACPSSGLRDVPTWQDGTYDFYMVSPGTYCVSVDTTYVWNGSILLPGTWTYPMDAVGNTIANQTITVSAGQKLNNVNFGWWYQFGSGWGSSDGTVFGMVWHDMCAYTPGDPIPNPLPDGCVLDQWGNVHADAIHQIEEPGIPGVVVDIGPGDCPSAGLATSVTDANGYYHFSDLAAGKYCLRVDPVHNPINAAILLPGVWTYIPSGHEGMTFRAITVSAAHTLAGEDFGWDFDNLPVQPTPTPTPTVVPAQPIFTLTINAYCRMGPDIRYDKLTSYPAGRAFPIMGKSPDGLWYYAALTDIARCWFSASVGTASGDLSKLRTFYGPPLPTATVVPVLCSSYKDVRTCQADPTCKWVFGTAGPAGCTAK